MSLCSECGRPRPGGATALPPEPTTYCGECLVPFSLDEIAKLFAEANLMDSNTARQLRRALFGDLLARLQAACRDRGCVTWRRDPPPRGVRCLVTWRGPDGQSLPRLRIASVSPDYEDEYWFSDGERLHHVIAWMPAPVAARDAARDEATA